MSIGDDLYALIKGARAALFTQGELAQLSYGALDLVATQLDKSDREAIEVSYPVGFRADKSPILSTHTYTKEALLSKYQFLAFAQLPINGIASLVVITEATLGDIVRAVIAAFPQKLPAKKSIPMRMVLEAKSVADMQLRAADILINEMSYKSPREFAEALNELIGVNLLECPAYHRYVEVKATRDIHVHNRGIANDTYVRKAGSHARVQSGLNLPVDIAYFLEGYESCLQLSEWLEVELNDCWHSSRRDEDMAEQATRSEDRRPIPGEDLPRGDSLLDAVMSPEDPGSQYTGAAEAPGP